MKDTVMQEATLTVEHVLRETRISADTIKHSHEAFRRHVELKAEPSAGWHGAGDIVTLKGLGGDYFWAENPSQPARMKFTFDPAYVGSQGTYKIESLPWLTEEGVFYCVPNNPAVGWAFISLVPKSGSPRSFTVAGMFTDAAWKISILMLNKLDAHGPVQPPFSALRMM